MDQHNLTHVKDEYLNDNKENCLEGPKKKLNDYYNLPDIKDEYLHDVKEKDLEDTKGDELLRVKENENLRTTAQILEVIKLKEISKPVKYIKDPVNDGNQPVFLEKRGKREDKLSESSLFTLVGGLCSIVEEDRQEKQTSISPKKDPLSDLYITQTEPNFKCSTCQKSSSKGAMN